LQAFSIKIGRDPDPADLTMQFYQLPVPVPVSQIHKPQQDLSNKTRKKLLRDADPAQKPVWFAVPVPVPVNIKTLNN
jgi:hypothetical protein